MPWAWKNTCSRTWHLCAHSHTEGYFVLFRFFHLSLSFSFNSFLLFFFHAVIVLLQPWSVRAVLFYDGLFASREFVVWTSIINLGFNEVEIEKRRGLYNNGRQLEAFADVHVRCRTNGDSINIFRAIKTTPPARRGVFFDSQSIFSCYFLLTPSKQLKREKKKLQYMKWGVDEGKQKKKYKIGNNTEKEKK